MSRLYFHTPSGTAALHGSERAHLRRIATGPARTAWGFDRRPGFDWMADIAFGPARAAWAMDRHRDVEWMADIIGLVPEVPDGLYGSNYLHTYLREAQAEDARNAGLWAAWKELPNRGPANWPNTNYDAQQRLRSSLDLRLTGAADTTFVVDGHQLDAFDVALNTALVAGDPVVQLAAKLYGWCEVHAWFDGPDRAWLADIIDEGLRSGIYRRGLWYADQPDTPKDRWSDQGWADVQKLLRARDDEPVVTSYSVCDSFPNRVIAGWEAPPMPDGWVPTWVRDDAEYRTEWEANHPTTEDRAEEYADHAGEIWGALPDDEQWRMALDGLKTAQPWAQITPDNLAEVGFGSGITVYDLLAPDRTERVRAHFADADDDTGHADEDQAVNP